jgi:holo-[acyl-carrier protein] synthase
MKPEPTLLERTIGNSAAGPRSRRRVGSDRSGPSPVRVGVDLVPVVDVADSVERFGRRYLERVFTPHEVECCRHTTARAGRAPGYSAESLAARFAAKEATLKVLRPEGWRPDWRSIEVRRTGGGWCEINLSGRAAALAAEAGIDVLEVSLTHESMVAVAVVVGRCTSGETPSGKGEA